MRDIYISKRLSQKFWVKKCTHYECNNSYFRHCAYQAQFIEHHIWYLNVYAVSCADKASCQTRVEGRMSRLVKLEQRPDY